MFLYRLLSTLALLLYAPVAAVKSLTGRRRLGDIAGRLGKRPYPNLSGGVWIHAVSVGEVGVARSLVESLFERAPALPVGLSVTTAAGRDLAQRNLGGRIPIFAFPFDLPRPVERALTGVAPGLVLLTETEIWPLFLQRAGAHGIAVALVNGRISPRSFGRYLRARRFLSGVLGGVSLFAMQSAEDAERIRALGAPADRIRVTGNAKYDLPPAVPFADHARLLAQAQGRPIFVAASTAPGEESVVIEAWRSVADRCLLALAPRRPERFDDVAALVESAGLRLLRRSSPAAPSLETTSQTVRSSAVYLLDSVGELASLYREVSFAWIGGSLTARGGHNPIEAWAQGVPVATGPHMDNFREIAQDGERGGFLSRTANASDLASILRRWTANLGAARLEGERAREFVASNRGAARRTADLVLPLLGTGAPRRRISS